MGIGRVQPTWDSGTVEFLVLGSYYMDSKLLIYVVNTFCMNILF